MSRLKSLETKIAGLVEGTFSRAFKSEVRPMEIARRLAREMDEHRSPSLSKVYVPNEYAVWLSPGDTQRFGEVQDALRAELSGYLLEHARREHYALLSRPSIEFRTDERLSLGEFGIEARVASASPSAAPPPPPPPASDTGRTMVHSSAVRLSEPLQERARARESTATLSFGGKRMTIGAAGAVLGRSRECDVTVDDANVSRRHAEIRPRGGSWVLSDLNSTNGVLVNGVRVDRPRVLSSGDVLELGSTQVTFSEE